MGEDRDALGLTAAERAEVLAATTMGGERGALAALVLQWPPHPVRTSWLCGMRNIARGECRVHKAAFRLFKARLGLAPTGKGKGGKGKSGEGRT